MDRQLELRIEACRRDFARETGRPFEHFHCPILRRDEATEMCKAHVIPAALRSCSTWVPQRADVDSFFGWAVESEFIGVIEAKRQNAFGVWLDPKLRKRHRPRIESEGQIVEHYFPRSSVAVPHHSPVQVASEQGETICSIVVKKSPEEMKSFVGKKVYLVVEGDYRSATIASTLKAAHLTMFSMLGYRHVYSPAGQYLAEILKKFYLANVGVPQASIKEARDAYFLPLSSMVLPLIMEGESSLQGTVSDRHILACHGARGGVFAIGVIIKVGEHAFCSFLPSDDGSMIDVYFGFLREPPESISARIVQFIPEDGERSPYWSTNDVEPMRIPLTVPTVPDGSASKL